MIRNTTTLLIAALVMMILSCKKDSNEPALPQQDRLKMMLNKFWVEEGSMPIMKFRFYGDSSVTYHYASSWFPLKYDSIENATWRLIPPDTIRFFSTNNFTFGSYRLLDISDSVMITSIPNFSDTTLFRRVY